MSVQTPATVQDLFDRLQVFADFKAIAIDKGIDTTAFEAFFSQDTGATRSQVAAALKFAPGSGPKLVVGSDGKLYGYQADASGVDGYAEVIPVPASTLGLDGSTLAPPNTAPVAPPPTTESAPDPTNPLAQRPGSVMLTASRPADLGPGVLAEEKPTPRPTLDEKGNVIPAR